MAPTHTSPSRPTSPSRRNRSCTNCERRCWTFLTHLPLAFVYGLTTWAIWTEVKTTANWGSYRAYSLTFLGVLFYVLANWSYTTAVFTDPGSPTSSSPSSALKSGYSHLPTHEPDQQPELPSFTVKSTGGARYCKKCQARKPDRAHHCSTCKRCVLKMDHHCPWLATCVGLRNYKPFLLFLIYVTFFCWVCFGVSGTWLWSEIFNEEMGVEQGLMGINIVLLAVLSGILGLVLTGFTGWHISLALRGQTTIECLEKTRYLNPLRKSMQRQNMGVDENGGPLQRYGQQLAEIHTNALPGVTRMEEGEERSSPAPTGDMEQGMTAREALMMNYNEMERSRERQRYENYLDEQDSEKLPNAFDLGWRKNLTQLFGDKPLLWFIPLITTQGDGWRWEPCSKWLAAREEIRQKREVQWREQERREQEASWTPQNGHANGPANGPPQDRERHYLATSKGVTRVPPKGTRSPGKANKVLGRSSDQYFDGTFEEPERPGSGMSMRTLRRKGSFDGRSDEDDEQYEHSEDPDKYHGSWIGQSGSSSNRGAPRKEDGWSEEWD